MPRSGTLVICVQNLDFSGANQVVLNIVSGRMHESNVIVLSPKIGAFAGRFVESGAAVRIGDLETLLNEIRDVFCIICNTIMTANIVVEMSRRPHPVIWILHEWWDDEMIEENLRMRNYQGLTLNTVKQALASAATVVCVCESQRQLYSPTAPSTVIFVGVPDPRPRLSMAPAAGGVDTLPALGINNLGIASPQYKKGTFTILCLGIVCPRKNQLWTVQMFKKFKADKVDVRLQVVGARHTRVYEIEYLDQVKEEIGGDEQIELLDVTDNVDHFYLDADCLMLTSVNEVTPMVISEAMSWGLPVISTNIAGIKEMFTDGVEGYHFPPGDEERALHAMNSLYHDHQLRQRMSKAARERFESTFDLDIMVESYRRLVVKVAPPVVLLDMDGALIDWDSAFLKLWNNRSPVDRSKSYFMEQCVDPAFRDEAITIFRQQGFFENLEPMEGALQAVREMERDGLKLYICTSPLKNSKYCAQEKLNWVRNYLGEAWLDHVILCQDKTMVAGDLLIDDKPYEYLAPGGKHTTATWKQIIFDAPYNRQKRAPRMFRWADWKSFVYPMLGKYCPEEVYANSYDEYCDLRDSRFRVSGFPGMPTKLKMKRDNSLSSTISGMSAENVQRQYDMLISGDAPIALEPEDIATITSGSFGQMDGDSPPEVSRKSLNEKNLLLQDKLRQRSEEHKKAKDSLELEERLRANSVDIDGVHVFRPSYTNWKCQGGGSRKYSARAPSPNPTSS